uniref:potassium channel SKOR-like n=1 Tax=Erigeron canadensis TaxID=72917 RepID=UPI001CB981F3|nr:potassium channel SKOR-like [Erigeron canadensis]
MSGRLSPIRSNNNIGRRSMEKLEDNDHEDEYKVEDIRDEDDDDSDRGKRRRNMLTLLAWDIGGLDLSSHNREKVIDGIKGFFIHPRSRWYRMWEKFILLWAVYSSFFTPMEFGFFRGLPENLYLLDIFSQAAFLVDIFLQFFVAYRDSQTYKIVVSRRLIAIRYVKSHFIFDVLACMPWDVLYTASGKKEEVRYLLLIRLVRARKVLKFFSELEKDIRVKYLFSRIIKLIAVELYCTHTAACIFYYLATTLPAAEEEYTWIGSLKLGDYSYSNFRDIDLWNRYITSLYFAIVTMATVGYGDIHAVNLREMIFVMVYVSFDMVLGAYLIGNMTALIVKGSKTERYRDRMTDLLKYMNRNRLGRDIRDQIKGHMRLQYDSSYTDSAVIQDLPSSIRARISETLYKSYIEKASIFRGCSSEFINHVVTRVHEEFFLPGEVILEQGTVVDQVYFVCHGKLDAIVVCEDGSEEKVSVLNPHDSFGDVSILCNIPQTYTIRVQDLTRLLRLDKQSFSNILEIYFQDGRKILNNLLKGKENDVRMKHMVTDITVHIEMQEAELALRVNSSAHNGDLAQLKSLIRAGADPNKTDYDGRSPLHLAASKGHESIAFFLIQNGADVNISDKFGNTPLLEAIKNGHENIASLIGKEGGLLNIQDPGSFLCSYVAKGDLDFIRRILSYGIDPNSKDYDFRTPLHVATSQGIYLIAKLLVEAGASVLLRDRWGNTPIDEARVSGNKILIKLLEQAKSSQLSGFPSTSLEPTDRKPERKCTVYPYQPWEPKDQTKYGVVLWVPENIDELMKTAATHLNLDVLPSSCIITEDAGKLLDVDMITDGQKLYLVTT